MLPIDFNRTAVLGPGRKLRRTPFSRLLVIVWGVLSSLAILEAAIRLMIGFRHDWLEDLVAPHIRGKGDELVLRDLVQVSDDDHLVYELRPGVAGSFRGHPLFINSLGMRDVDRDPKKSPTTFRIIGLGDSHMFGWGVSHDETFLAILESLLNDKLPNRKWEVWNLAVPGYNTVQEVESFAVRMPQLQPDLVVINYVDNDMDLPNFLVKRPRLWRLNKSFLLEFIDQRLARRPSLTWSGELVDTSIDQSSQHLLFEPGRTPERYRSLVGWDNMLNAFKRLREIADGYGIPAILLINMDDYRYRLNGRTTDIRPGRVRDLANTCANYGYLVVDPQDRITAFLTANHLGNEAVWLTSEDSHTNPLRHRLVAEELYDAIARCCSPAQSN